jgi:hypothetical protein
VLVFSVGIGSVSIFGWYWKWFIWAFEVLESLTVCIFITFIFFWLLSGLLRIVCG